MKARSYVVGLLVLALFIAILPNRTPVFATQRALKSATATIEEPADGATVSGTTTIKVYASSSYTMHAYLYIDGVQKDSWSTKGERSWNWDATTYSNGNHEIKLVVYDYWWIFQIDVQQDIHTVTVNNGGTEDTTPPTVTITSPEDGATLTSSSVTVTWTGSDDQSGIDYYEIRLDSGDWINVGTSTSYTFENVADGSHTSTVQAWDKAGNSNTDSVSFTVDTSGGGGTEPITYTFTGSVSAGTDSQRHSFNVPDNAAKIEVKLELPSGADFDLSVWDSQGQRTGGWTASDHSTKTDITNSQYSGYSANPEWVTVEPPVVFGTWETGCYAYSGSGSYTITVTITPSSGGGGGDGVVNHYAVIVGISDYKAINDLSYCDEDASDWYNHLVNNLGWSSSNIKVYGDGHSSNYPKWDGYATEYNVKQALNWLVSTADADDVIAFISSGHGSGDGHGSSYLCMWDCSAGENGEDGDLYDTELAAILDDAVADRIFVFLDHCYSGGFGDDLMNMPNKAHVYLTTTCTENGYGYDDPDHQNGAWTYYFLEYSWQQHFNSDPNAAMEDVFQYAHDAYPHGGGDEPQQFDGDTSSYFYLN